MNPEAPMRGNRRGFRRGYWLILPALPIAALLLANLWLACPPARTWIATKIQHRAGGLECRVSGASISPWKGVSLQGVELLQPPPLRAALKDPLARIETIRLAPVWRSWLRGKPELQSIELDSPRLVIPMELLADLARSQAPATTPAPAQPPVVAAAPPVASATSPATAPATPTAPPASAEVPAVPLPPTGWLRLKNASFTLLSATSGKTRFEASGVTGSIPISGSSAKSKLRIHSMHLIDQEILTDLESSLEWNAPLLSASPLETNIHGVKLILAGKIALRSGLPLQIEAQVPRQSLASIQLPHDNFIAADAIGANARFRGILLAPGTWQCDLIAEAIAPSARFAGHDAKFDRGGAVIVLRGGMLSCVDARLIGDDLSLLGNATLLADGRAAAALRMVTQPDTANAIVNRVFPNIPQPPALTPMSTPQRAAFDLEAFGNIRQIFLRLGKDGPVMELKR